MQLLGNLELKPVLGIAPTVAKVSELKPVLGIAPTVLKEMELKPVLGIAPTVLKGMELKPVLGVAPTVLKGMELKPVLGIAPTVLKGMELKPVLGIASTVLKGMELKPLLEIAPTVAKMSELKPLLGIAPTVLKGLELNPAAASLGATGSLRAATGDDGLHDQSPPVLRPSAREAPSLDWLSVPDNVAADLPTIKDKSVKAVRKVWSGVREFWLLGTICLTLLHPESIPRQFLHDVLTLLGVR